jgi:hypothetical protein
MTMVRRLSATGAVLALLSCALPAAAEDGHWTLGVSGGTLGIGPELAYRFNEHVGLRANMGQYSYDLEEEELDDIEYDGEIDLDSMGLMLDWYPGGGGFRVSIGGRINNNEILLEGRPIGFVEIGDEVYPGAALGTINGVVVGDDFAPALTIGYGGKLAPGFTVGFELGVIMQGSPQIENLRVSNPTFNNDPDFRAELRREEAIMEEDISDFEFWPVIQLHLLYRF